MGHKYQTELFVGQVRIIGRHTNIILIIPITDIIHFKQRGNFNFFLRNLFLA